MPLTLLLAFLPTLLWPPPTDAAPWRWPLTPHAVAAPFDFDSRMPYEGGARRGVDLAAAPGALVHSACAGRVAYAGPLPAGGLGVSVRCGRLVATHLGLAVVGVRRGSSVRAGAPIGSLGPAGRLRLGARVAAERHGYRDPLTLLGDRSSHAPLGPAPRGRGRASHPYLTPAPILVRAQGAHAQAVSPLLLAGVWLGLGLFGTAIGAGIGLRVRTRRSPTVDVSRADAADRP